MHKLVLHSAAFLLVFGAGFFLAWWFFSAPAPVEPKTEIISGKTYEQMFDMPQFKPIPARFYVVPTVTETKVVEVPVPVDRPLSDMRLFYGDITVEQDRVRLGVFNPKNRQYEAQEIVIPQARFDFERDVFAGWPVQVETGLRLKHRSGVYGRIKGGFMMDTVYFGAGLGITF